VAKDRSFTYSPGLRSGWAGKPNSLILAPQPDCASVMGHTLGRSIAWWNFSTPVIRTDDDQIPVKIEAIRLKIEGKPFKINIEFTP
jgi:hypothetical protein